MQTDTVVTQTFVRIDIHQVIWIDLKMSSRNFFKHHTWQKKSLALILSSFYTPFSPRFKTKNDQRKMTCIKWCSLNQLLGIMSTWAYACIVSRSSCAVKRQYSVRVMSSDRVPPGAVPRKQPNVSNRIVTCLFSFHYTLMPTDWTQCTLLRASLCKPLSISPFSRVPWGGTLSNATHPAFHRPPGCQRVSLHIGGSRAWRQRHPGTLQLLPNQCQFGSSLVRYFLETEKGQISPFHLVAKRHVKFCFVFDSRPLDLDKYSRTHGRQQW